LVLLSDGILTAQADLPNYARCYFRNNASLKSGGFLQSIIKFVEKKDE